MVKTNGFIQKNNENQSNRRYKMIFSISEVLFLLKKNFYCPVKLSAEIELELAITSNMLITIIWKSILNEINLEKAVLTIYKFLLQIVEKPNDLINRGQYLKHEILIQEMLNDIFEKCCIFIEAFKDHYQKIKSCYQVMFTSCQIASNDIFSEKVSKFLKFNA